MISVKKAANLSDLDLGQAQYNKMSSTLTRALLVPASYVLAFLYVYGLLNMFMGLSNWLSVQELSALAATLTFSIYLMYVWKNIFVPYELYRLIMLLTPYSPYRKKDKAIIANIKIKLIHALKTINLEAYIPLAEKHGPELLTDIDILLSVTEGRKDDEHLEACLCNTLFVLSTYDILTLLANLDSKNQKKV